MATTKDDDRDKRAYTLLKTPTVRAPMDETMSDWKEETVLADLASLLLVSKQDSLDCECIDRRRSLSPIRRKR